MQRSAATVDEPQAMITQCRRPAAHSPLPTIDDGDVCEDSVTLVWVGSEIVARPPTGVVNPAIRENARAIDPASSEPTPSIDDEPLEPGLVPMHEDIAPTPPWLTPRRPLASRLLHSTILAATSLVVATSTYALVHTLMQETRAAPVHDVSPSPPPK